MQGQEGWFLDSKKLFRVGHQYDCPPPPQDCICPTETEEEDWLGLSSSSSSSSSSSTSSDTDPCDVSFSPVGNHSACHCDIDDPNLHYLDCEASIRYRFEEIRRKQRKFEDQSHDRRLLYTHHGTVMIRYLDCYQRQFVNIEGDDCSCKSVEKKPHSANQEDCAVCKQQQNCPVCSQELLQVDEANYFETHVKVNFQEDCRHCVLGFEMVRQKCRKREKKSFDKKILMHNGVILTRFVDSYQQKLVDIHGNSCDCCTEHRSPISECNNCTLQLSCPTCVGELKEIETIKKSVAFMKTLGGRSIKEHQKRQKKELKLRRDDFLDNIRGELLSFKELSLYHGLELEYHPSKEFVRAINTLEAMKKSKRQMSFNEKAYHLIDWWMKKEGSPPPPPPPPPPPLTPDKKRIKTTIGFGYWL